MIARDENGQLQKGSVLNPRGRPKKEREHDYLNIMLSIVTDKRWKAIVTKAADQAERGDPVARKWLADYIVGPPVERREITGADNQPLTIRVVYDEDNNE